MNGWTPYPRRLVQGVFQEDLDLIIELLGTHLYEWREDNHGKVWIRRLK
jgi:hypothetical protein